MRTFYHQKEKEHAVKSVIRNQFRKHSDDVMKDITNEIVLAAKKISSIFLGDVFRNIFSLEKSCEYCGPYIFNLGGDTDQILYDRLNPQQLANLPFSIMNEEVLAKGYHPMRELNFVVIIDLSFSMLYRWPLTKLTGSDKYISASQAEDLREQCRKTKLYALKYLTYAFIDSAIQNHFKVNVIFFSNQIQYETIGTADKRFPSFILHYIDEHLVDSYAKVISRDRYSEVGGYLNALINFMYKRKKCFVLFLSDFLDGIEDLKPYLIELQQKAPLIMGVINDPFEIKFPSRKFITPVTVSYEHCKNLEQELGGGIRLSSKLIKEYNMKAVKRRKDIFDFFTQRKIKYLDIQTQNNDKIPLVLQKFNAQLLEET